MEPVSVELSRRQTIEILNRVAGFKGKPAGRVLPRQIMQAMAGVAGWDDKGKTFPESEELKAARQKADAADKARRNGPVEPPEQAARERLHQEAQAELQATFSEWFEKTPVFVPWDRAEKRWIWKMFREELESECTLPREDAIVAIGKALGKAGEINDIMAEAIEEAEKGGGEPEESEEPEEPKPAGS